VNTGSVKVLCWEGWGLNTDIIFTIAGIGILISILGIVLKQAQKEEQAQMLTLAGVVVVLILVVQLLSQLFTVVRTVFNL
jgi:stage III sporulation protein AC